MKKIFTLGLLFCSLYCNAVETDFTDIPMEEEAAHSDTVAALIFNFPNAEITQLCYLIDGKKRMDELPASTKANLQKKYPELERFFSICDDNADIIGVPTVYPKTKKLLIRLQEESKKLDLDSKFAGLPYAILDYVEKNRLNEEEKCLEENEIQQVLNEPKHRKRWCCIL